MSDYVVDKRRSLPSLVKVLSIAFAMNVQTAFLFLLVLIFTVLADIPTKNAVTNLTRWSFSFDIVN